MTGRPSHAVRLLPILAAFVGLLCLPVAQGLVLQDPVRLVLTGPVVAPDGEDLVLIAPEIVLDHASLGAGQGIDGASVEQPNQAIAGNGHAGGSILLHGQAVCLASTLRPGDGGRGGDAFAWGTRADLDALARGGAGGDAGRLVGDAPGCTVLPARAGAGGSALAAAASGCDGGAGTAASDDHRNDTATVGPGKDGQAAGTSGGAGGTCGSSFGNGGTGGDASAYGGPGGIRSSDFEGANGGNATALAGSGGPGGGLCASDAAAFKQAWDAGLRQAGTGGAGGKAYAIGGDGGTGGTTGGNGGRAVAVSQGGAGGAGTNQGSDVIAAGKGGDVLPGTEARGGNGGMGLSGGGGGQAKSVTLKGPDGRLCDLGAKSVTFVPTASPSTSGSSTASDAKGSPGVGAVAALLTVGAALVMRGRRGR